MRVSTAHNFTRDQRACITCYTVLTRPNKVEVAILGFQFGLYHVVAPLSFLHSNQPCIIVCYSFYFWLIRSFTDPSKTGSIFVCGPLHHYVKLSSILGTVGLFRSDMLLILYMVWPRFSCGTVCVCPQFPCRGNDMIFWIFPIVPRRAFCM